jgi:hypothetical protein
MSVALGGPVSAQGPKQGAEPAKGKTFIIQRDDGYGVSDCLERGPNSCGQVVADAYCESQGFAKAQSFGKVDPSEITGSIPKARNRAPQELLIITCKE